jgi:hypothetical protein
MTNQTYKTDIYLGEEVRLPEKLFVTLNRSRLISTRCIGRTKTGLLFESYFQPAFGTEEPDRWKYKQFITYASIYCGDIHIIRRDGTQVKALRTVEEMRA